MRVSGTGAENNQVLGNYVGTDPSGSAAIGNGGDGISLDYEAHNNTVGGTEDTGNHVRYNAGTGIFAGMNSGCEISHNTVTDNEGVGVVAFSATDCEVAYNTLGGNGQHGVAIAASSACEVSHNNVVRDCSPAYSGSVSSLSFGGTDYADCRLDLPVPYFWGMFLRAKWQ